jgi:hypothetical protein
MSQFYFGEQEPMWPLDNEEQLHLLLMEELDEAIQDLEREEVSNG